MDRKKVLSFSYPFGSKNDYTVQTKRIARRLFNNALANYEGVVLNKTDLYEIPRILVRDWDVNEFNKVIDSYCSCK